MVFLLLVRHAFALSISFTHSAGTLPFTIVSDVRADEWCVEVGAPTSMWCHLLIFQD